MEKKSRKRHGALIFTLVFVAIAGGIGATALLANDGRNLKIVMRQLGIETRILAIPKPASPEPLAGKSFKSNRLEGTSVQLPGQMFLQPVMDRDGAFLRTLAGKDGEGLCQLLRREGFDMSEWAGGAFTPTVLECAYEANIPNLVTPGESSTFFMMIKGTASGDLVSARAKIVVTDLDAQPKLATQAATALNAFALHTRWLDFADAVPKVAALEPFNISSHGMTVRLQKEFSGPGQFNLILAASSPLTKAQRRTQDYFARARYWPLLPEHGGPKPKPAVHEPVDG